ncbi:MAG: hypothetical protein ACRELV_15675 [Longimicrobiales bacterium]
MNSSIVRRAVLAVVLLNTPVVAQDPPTSGDFQPGDAVWRQPDLSGEFMIDDGGFIQHPLYKEISELSVAFAEAEARIAWLLCRYEAQPRLRDGALLDLVEVARLPENRAPGEMADVVRVPVEFSFIFIAESPGYPLVAGRDRDASDATYFPLESFTVPYGALPLAEHLLDIIEGMRTGSAFTGRMSTRI